MKITKKNILEFNNNKAINFLGKFPLWTISNLSTLDGKKKKVPLSASLVVEAANDSNQHGSLIPKMIKIARNKKRSIGCSPKNKDDLLTLDELELPSLYGANRTLYVNVKDTNFIVLDIENECTPELAKTLLSLPIAYVEQSVSGGLHALIYLDKEMRKKYSDLLDITVFKYSVPGIGTYEVFFNNHFITLTRCCVKLSDLDISGGAKLTLDDFLQLIREEHGKKQALDTHSNILKLQNSGEEDSIPKISKIISYSLPDEVMNSMFEMNPADYLSDNSRYENAVVFKAANAIKRAFLMYKENDYMVKNTGKKYYQLTYKELVYAVYITVKRVIPPRGKHSTKRNGLPFLLYLSSLCINTLKKDEEQAYTQIKRKESRL